MLRPGFRGRARDWLFAIAGPITLAAVAACDAGSAGPLAPELAPQLDVEQDPPVPIVCNDPTPLQKFTAPITPAGGVLNMGPNVVVVPPNAVAFSGILYLVEKSATTLRVNITSTVPLLQPLEVIVSTENCEIADPPAAWLYDEDAQLFDEPVVSAFHPLTENMRFWTLQPGAYALAD